MKPKEVSIMIERAADGWHVVVHVDGALVERSPPLPDRDTAMAKAKVVKDKFEAAVGRNWRRER